MDIIIEVYQLDYEVNDFNKKCKVKVSITQILEQATDELLIDELENRGYFVDTRTHKKQQYEHTI